MKKTISIVSNLLLSSTLFWGVAAVGADELASKESSDVSAYCNMKFPPMREGTLSWKQPVLDENAGKIIDFYGPCDYDPTGALEKAHQRNHFTGDND
jgi:hypothetical protein